MRDAALVEEHHAVGHFAGEAHFMGDHDHRHAAAREFAHHVQHFLHHFRVQGGGGLVEQHHLGPHGQRAGDGHALLLAARELPGVLVGMLAQAHAAQQLQGLFVRLGARRAVDAARRERHVVEHAHVAEQVELLEHHADLAALLLQDALVVGDFHAADGDAAAVVRLQPVDGAQQRGLARAGGADDHGDLARVEHGGDILEHLVRAERLADVLRHDVGRGGGGVRPVHWARPSTSKRCSMAFETWVTSVVSSR